MPSMICCFTSTSKMKQKKVRGWPNNLYFHYDYERSYIMQNDIQLCKQVVGLPQLHTDLLGCRITVQRLYPIVWRNSWAITCLINISSIKIFCFWKFLLGRPDQCYRSRWHVCIAYSLLETNLVKRKIKLNQKVQYLHKQVDNKCIL